MEQKNGFIKYVNSEKRFGFIAPAIPGRPDVCFFFDQLRGNAARIPQRGEKVVYEEGTGARGPIATTVYNLSDPVALEEHVADLETAQRLAAAKQLAQEGQKRFLADLIERNKAWHAARTPQPDMEPKRHE